MARIPTVAIIGRPNTGKSTLFNCMVGRRKAIVSDVPGTTRDQIAARVEADDLDFLLIDTAGIGGGSEDKELEADVRRQTLLALDNADLIVFTVNGQEDLTRSDFAVTEMLRSQKKKHVPVILVITKCDDPRSREERVLQYFELGIASHVIGISAPHGIGMEELMSSITNELHALHFRKEEKPVDTDIPRVAVIGKPNVGKSSLVNALMSDPQRERSPMLVSDIPGTTRDAVDTVIRHDDKEYVFIDTAGMQKKPWQEEGIESYALLRSIRAVQECDVAVLVLDATQALSRQDKRLAGLATQEGKGLILLLNKMDLLDAEKKKEKMAELQIAFKFCTFAPVLTASAVTREGLLRLFPLISVIQQSRLRRIATKDLRRWYEDAVADQPLGILGKTKHITQAEDVPPTFVLFVRDPKQVQVSQLRYLENRLRETFAFEGTPVRWVTKEQG